MEANRRDFLKGAAFASLAAAAGCRMPRFCAASGAPMAGFAAPRLERVRVAFVGVGSRGSSALGRIRLFPGVDVVAICDVKPEAIAKCQKMLADVKRPPAKEFLGPEAYKDLAQWDGADVVYAATPWELHAPVGLEAMRGGKHALLEVPATMTVDECWNLVETSEATRRHCMMLENCCYGENELLMLNLCRLGLLGEAVHGEAGYLHYYWPDVKKGKRWRDAWYEQHCGNIYPTHGLGPIAQAMGINRGDRFDYLVSADSLPVGRLAHGKKAFPPDSLEAAFFEKFQLSYYNTSVIKTVGGRTIHLAISMHAPHPYSRINALQGTRGVFRDYPLRIAFETERNKGGDSFAEKRTEEIRTQYRHPLWKQVGEVAKKLGGHGGMDFIMDMRWIYCLQNGLPLDMDVYDLASWSCLCEITERSCRGRGKSVDVPDFTRGAWKTMQPLGVESVDLGKMRFDAAPGAGRQQSV